MDFSVSDEEENLEFLILDPNNEKVKNNKYVKEIPTTENRESFNAWCPLCGAQYPFSEMEDHMSSKCELLMKHCKNTLCNFYDKQIIVTEHEKNCKRTMLEMLSK